MSNTSSDVSISVNDIVELAISWPESMCNKEGKFSPYATLVMVALDAHCNAMNALDDTPKRVLDAHCNAMIALDDTPKRVLDAHCNAMNALDDTPKRVLDAHCNAVDALDDTPKRECLEYMKAVDERISEVKEQLGHVQRLVYTSGGLRASGIVPIAVAVCNILNPVGLCAMVVGVGVFGAAHGFHNGGKRAVEDVVAMIEDSSERIKASTHGNAITRTASTMQPLVELLRQNFGESAKAAYCFLLGRLNAISKKKLFDLNKIPEVIRELTDTFRSSDFFKQASDLPAPSEELEKKRQASLEKLKTVVAKSALAKDESRPILPNVGETVGLLMRFVDYKNGSSKDKLQSRMQVVVELAGSMWKAFLSLGTFQAIELCASIKSELKPFNDMLDDLRRDHYAFADSVQSIPTKVKYYHLVGK